MDKEKKYDSDDLGGFFVVGLIAGLLLSLFLGWLLGLNPMDLTYRSIIEGDQEAVAAFTQVWEDADKKDSDAIKGRRKLILMLQGQEEEK